MRVLQFVDIFTFQGVVGGLFDDIDVSVFVKFVERVGIQLVLTLATLLILHQLGWRPRLVLQGMAMTMRWLK